MKEAFQSDQSLRDDIDSVAGKRGLHLWWLGQSGFLMKWGPWLSLIDPYLSDSLTKKYAKTEKPHVRISKRVIDPATFSEIMFVAASHAHTDHLDGETLAAIRKTNFPTLIAPRAIRSVVEERWGSKNGSVALMNEGESQLYGDIAIRAIPAAHETIERDDDGNCRHLGYVFGFGPNEFTVYHSGDTVLYDGLVERLRSWNIDVALLPINGRAPVRRVAGNLNGREAAWLANEIGAKLVIPCHYDMFEFNTADPNDEFVPECERIGQRYRVLRQGERFSSSEI